MQKCIILGDWVQEKVVGVQRYAQQILLEIDRRIDSHEVDLDIEIVIPSNSQWQSPFKNIAVKKIGSETSKIEKYIWQHWTFPYYVRQNKGLGIDLTGALPVWGCDICAIHDCIPDAYPENFAGHELFCKLQIMKESHSMRIRGRKIVTLTNDSKQEIIKYHGNKDDRISLVTCGWEHMEKIVADDGIFSKLPIIKDKEYFFSLGSRYKHKNFRWVIDTAKRNPQYQFVITGTDNYSSVDGELNSIKPSNVVFTGYISDGEIKSLMQHCRALIQPSLYEGFGLPPLEALSQGAEIIVSNASCLPEIYRKSAYYIDPYSEGCDLDKLLEERTENPAEILKEYSWKRAADQLLNLIHSFEE